VRGHYVVREALEMQAARLFTEAATTEERAELIKLAARVDAVRLQFDANRMLYPTLHAKLHRRIAECARCLALSEVIDKTNALSSTWLCVPDPKSASERPQWRHQELMEILTTGTPEKAAEAMRVHIAFSLEHALERLEPFFRLRKVQGAIYSRSPKPAVTKVAIEA
jgi:DNA-binding GntR family transcriptional regulator